MKEILLHICCAPCSVTCIERLREEGYAPIGLWYNPNIHLYTEYQVRRDTLIDYAKTVELPLLVQDEYGLDRFTQAVSGQIEKRCAFCYAIRMEETARIAAARGIAAFTTTLTVSPYQNHALINEIAAKAAKRYGVAFIPYDFSPRFREGQNRAREAGLYLQKYCGCVYSEQERYAKKREKDAKKFAKI